MSADLLDELADLTREPWAGPAPLHFTSAYFTPDQLLAAHAEATSRRDSRRPTRTWKCGWTTGWCGTAPGHSLCILDVDLRCNCKFRYTAAEWEESERCACVGILLSQANCPQCRWHHFGYETEVVEAWHDHAWPGWRDLPVVPKDLNERTGGLNLARSLDKRRAIKARAWVEANYPAEWQIDGAPIRSERHILGNRHVPGYSPWGGFDMASVVE